MKHEHHIEEETAEEREFKLLLAVNPHYRAPPPDREELKNFKYILLRHAVTAFNIELNSSLVRVSIIDLGTDNNTRLLKGFFIFTSSMFVFVFFR